MPSDAPAASPAERLRRVALHFQPAPPPPAAPAPLAAAQPAVASAYAPVAPLPPPALPWAARLALLAGRAELSRALPETDPGIARQRAQGKLTVRERFALLLDPGSFREHGTIAGATGYDPQDPEKLVRFQRANHICGRGEIGGRPVVVGGDDFSVRGGHADGAIQRKALYTEMLARELRVPLIRLVDGSSGGGSVATILKTGHSYIPTLRGFNHSVRMLDEIPVAAACLGPAVGLGAAKATLAHFTVMPRDIGSLFAAGPPVVVPATHETVTKAQLGGAAIHGTNGTADNIVEDEKEALRDIRRFLSYLPANRWTLPPVTEPVPPESDPADPFAILRVIPENNAKPYDPLSYLVLLADAGSLFEIGGGWAKEVRTFLARFGGRPCAVLAGDPRCNAGAIGARACDKLGRIIGIASTFHLPIVNFVDCPGFSVGTLAEKAATIRAGGRLTCVAYDSRVPWLTIVVRKAFGVAAGILVARGEGDESQANVRLAWPSGEWGSLPLAGGVEAAFKGQLEAIKDPGERERERVRLFRELQAVSSPVRSAEAFDVEEIVSPLDTRALVLEWIGIVYETRIPGLIVEDSGRGRGMGGSKYLP
ncbi:propionyl-CoA carboxylase [Hyaloraphidium curvatum]|nr:propionyl-CoA carboxylase [Hyaloraphidium curvatum]